MTILKGPSDAESFRLKESYGRIYTDPLPGCDIAPASDATYPSFTATKPPFALGGFTALRAVSRMSTAEYERIASLDPDARFDALRAIDKSEMYLNMGRGTVIHLWAEDLSHGRPCREFSDFDLQVHRISRGAADAAENYKAALVDFFHTYSPQLVATEYVIFHRDLNGTGYGATGDNIFEIIKCGLDGLYAIDWKSRYPSGDHACYPEEACQLGAVHGAQYMVVADPETGEAKRAPIPELAGGLVVSIRPDGSRLYPIDLDKGFAHYEQMHAWYVAQRGEGDAIGRVLPKHGMAPNVKANSGPTQPAVEESGPAKGAGDAPDEAVATSAAGATGRTRSSPQPTPPSDGVATPNLDALRARYRLLNDTEQAAFKALNIDPKDADAIKAGLDQVDGFAKPPALTPRAADPDPRPALCVAPDEGAEVNDTDVAALQKRYSELAANAKAWTGAVVAQGNDGHSWRINESTPTVRRYEIYRGVLALAEWSEGKADDVIRAIVTLIAGTTTIQNTTQPGVALGLLDADGATRFATIAGDLIADKFALAYREDGTPTLNAA